MKILNINILIALLALCFVSCDEDEELPEFLDNTEFGILLLVDVEGSEIVLDNIGTSSVSMDITYDDTERPVQSIVIQKTFVAADGTTSGTIEQLSVTASPTSTNLSISDLVSGIADLSVDDIVSGDSFQINFITNYADGLVVDTYGTGVNPNFTVTIVEE